MFGETIDHLLKFHKVCQGIVIQFQLLWFMQHCFQLMAYTEMPFIVFQPCQSLEDHLMTTEGNLQPHFLATRTSKAQVFSFYIILDRKLLPCQSFTSLSAFDVLFKCHFVFGVKYEDALSSLYTFLQTTVYNIDVVQQRKVQESRS